MRRHKPQQHGLLANKKGEADVKVLLVADSVVIRQCFGALLQLHRESLSLILRRTTATRPYWPRSNCRARTTALLASCT